ncbi:MAG: hypothetical protein GAK31_00385 [Stenotrophomonas maltophilia]|uniref:Transmembrane protein n=1 Tax=Stenotrophomonas maltophilia TaxID=40324 RepID=A0A7V8JN90_STEMA|nr:MAG: hypothetical protein GAK31_00385 [Stenotrophomonas maltophilia]
MSATDAVIPMARSKEWSLPEVAGLGSVLVTFGLIQGGLYLRGYWSAFGLDPFQFAAVSEVALAGLAGIGIVLVLMALGALLGGWIENRMSTVSSERKVMPWLLPSLVLVGLVGLVVLIWWTGAWVLLVGVVLTAACAAVVQLSPVVPGAVKDSPWLIYALALVVYVSIASAWLGESRARAVLQGGAKFLSVVSISGETLGGVNLVGRLGDSYVPWDPARKTTILVPVADVRKLEITQAAGAGSGAGR